VRKADNLPPFCAVVTKFGNLNFLEHSGPVQACNGTALLYIYHSDCLKVVGPSTSWSPGGLSRPVMGLIFFDGYPLNVSFNK